MASERITIFRTPNASDPVLGEIVRRLVEAYQPERIYLFGSVARGDAGPDRAACPGNFVTAGNSLTRRDAAVWRLIPEPASSVCPSIQPLGRRSIAPCHSASMLGSSDIRAVRMSQPRTRYSKRSRRVVGVPRLDPVLWGAASLQWTRRSARPIACARRLALWQTVG